MIRLSWETIPKEGFYENRHAELIGDLKRRMDFTLKELRFLMIDKNKHIKRIDLSKFPFMSYLGLIKLIMLQYYLLKEISM